jgi:predicted ATP-binding protein involved in virulence
MRLDKIHLKNYRAHADLEVAFNPHFNVLVGVNGSGKTSLLRGVCDAFSMIFLGPNVNVKTQTSLNEKEGARLSINIENGRFRFEPQYPVEIKLEGVWSTNKKFSYSMSTENQIQLSNAPHSPIVEWCNPSPKQDKNEILLTQDNILPIVGFYRADRAWQISNNDSVSAVSQKESRLDAYAQYWDASSVSLPLQNWVIKRCIARFQISSKTKKSFDEIVDELALVNIALQCALDDVKGLSFDIDQSSLLMEWLPSQENNTAPEPTSFENLSDGQRSMIFLIVDIARRMCLLNPQLGQKVTLKTPGVILIDELDLHLHPEWQQRIVKGLKQAFPAVQFIVASHSPQIIRELRPKEIILLQPEGTDTDHPKASYGLDSSEVLTAIMGAPARAVAFQEELDKLSEHIARNELGAAKDLLKELEPMLGTKISNIPILLGAQAFIHRKEVLGK